MKPTNYHLFDFLDFDPDLSRNESLWKAYNKTATTSPTTRYPPSGPGLLKVPVTSNSQSGEISRTESCCFQNLGANHVCSVDVTLELHQEIVGNSTSVYP